MGGEAIPVKVKPQKKQRKKGALGGAAVAIAVEPAGTTKQATQWGGVGGGPFRAGVDAYVVSTLCVGAIVFTIRRDLTR